MNLARYIDHTLLKPEATCSDIERLCAEAIEYGFFAVCVNPKYVELAAQLLRVGQDRPCAEQARVASVVNFPLGAGSLLGILAEARACLAAGADELDLVIDIGAARAGDWEAVTLKIAPVVEIAHQESALVKLIIETGLLTDAQKRQACAVASRVGVDFVKTSTGFAAGGGGATVEDVRLLRALLPPEIKIKASGGISEIGQMRTLIEAGAARIGTSRGMAILE